MFNSQNVQLDHVSCLSAWVEAIYLLGPPVTSFTGGDSGGRPKHLDYFERVAASVFERIFS